MEPSAATTRREALCGSGCSLARKGTSRLGGEQERGGDAHGAVEEGSSLEEITETLGLDPGSDLLLLEPNKRTGS